MDKMIYRTTNEVIPHDGGRSCTNQTKQLQSSSLAPYTSPSILILSFQFSSPSLATILLSRLLTLAVVSSVVVAIVDVTAAGIVIPAIIRRWRWWHHVHGWSYRDMNRNNHSWRNAFRNDNLHRISSRRSYNHLTPRHQHRWNLNLDRNITRWWRRKILLLAIWVV